MYKLFAEQINYWYSCRKVNCH